MQKIKGFTLIELMVVIVVIGVLSTVAIPKLLGMSAKAKVSEIQPATANWEHLQVAYHQQQNTVGKGSDIGFDKPSNSKNFVFDDMSIAGVLVMKNDKSALNNCPQNSTFTVITDTLGDKVTSRHVLGDSANCKMLIPSWSQYVAKIL